MITLVAVNIDNPTAPGTAVVIDGVPVRNARDAAPYASRLYAVAAACLELAEGRQEEGVWDEAEEAVGECVGALADAGTPVVAPTEATA